MKDLRIVPWLTAVSAESKSEISNSSDRKKNILVYVEEEGSNIYYWIKGNISLKRKITHKNIL